MEDSQKNCSVLGCNYYTIQNDDKVFYRFPFHNSEYLKKWILFCNKKEDWVPDKKSLMCSVMFFFSIV